MATVSNSACLWPLNVCALGYVMSGTLNALYGETAFAFRSIDTFKLDMKMPILHHVRLQ